MVREGVVDKGRAAMTVSDPSGGSSSVFASAVSVASLTKSGDVRKARAA